MEKILFVCLGNICRSPLGEGIMLHLISKQVLERRVQVDSAGTANYHVNEAPDQRTISNAKKNGVDIRSLRARQIEQADLEKFDRIFVMDQSNFEHVRALCKNEEQLKKVDYLLNELYPGENKFVPDPYYGKEVDFEEVFQLIYASCLKLLEPYLQA